MEQYSRADAPASAETPFATARRDAPEARTVRRDTTTTSSRRRGAALFIGFGIFWLVLGWLLTLMTAFYLSTLAELRHMLA